MTSSREAEDHFGGEKQETTTTTTTTTTTATTTTSWSRLKDPRIVRVSRAMGGSKDRHSKVCTVRGLRDRRVRLSVPTAIQLYDLQERLGLNQPSKVVDWLLNAAKDEIDELPPLQIPTSFAHMLTNNPLHHQQLLHKLKDVSGETSESRNDPSWMRSEEMEVENHGNNNNINNYAAANVNSSEMGASYNSFGRWDPSNLTLSSQHHQQHQLLAYHQSGMITQPYFSPQINAAFEANVRPFHFNMTADLLPSQNQQSKRE